MWRTRHIEWHFTNERASEHEWRGKEKADLPPYPDVTSSLHARSPILHQYPATQLLRMKGCIGMQQASVSMVEALKRCRPWAFTIL